MARERQKPQEFVEDIKSLIELSSELEEPQRKRVHKFLSSLVENGERFIEDCSQLRDEIDKLSFANVAAKRVVKMQVDNLTMDPDLDRRSETLNVLMNKLLAKPPEQVQKMRSRNAAIVGDVTYEPPEGLL